MAISVNFALTTHRSIRSLVTFSVVEMGRLFPQSHAPSTWPLLEPLASSL